MRLLLSGAVLLVLVITVTVGEYRFGDIIAFPATIPCIKVIVFKHFAFYVGKGKVDGLNTKPDDNDIFHYTGPAGIPLANCIFGKLDINKEQELANFHFGELPVSSKADMIKRINEKHKACGPYKLFSNNCEHLATYVRYGDGVSLQCGTDIGKHLVKNEKTIEQILKERGLEQEMGTQLPEEWSDPEVLEKYLNDFNEGKVDQTVCKVPSPAG